MVEHPGHQLGGLVLDPVGQRLDRIRTGERIHDRGQVGLAGQHLLGAQGQPGGFLARESDRFIVRVRVQRLCPAEYRPEGLYRHPDQVDLGLLRGELYPRGLRVEPQHPGLRVLRAELVAHQPGPHPPGRPELRDLLEQLAPGGKEERETAGELVDVETPGERRTHVIDAVGQGERDLLHGRRAGLRHVVPGNRDGVPLRYLGAAVGKSIGDQAQRRLGREDVRPSGDVLLEHVVLDRAAELVTRYPVLFGHELVQQQQDGRRGVDRHAGGDLVERDAVEEPAHVLDRVDRHADLADLAVRDRVVRVVAHLRGQVERDRQPVGTGGEQLVVALVGLGRGAEPGVLAHRPRPAGVHRRVHAAGERVLPGFAQPLGEVLGQVLGPVHGLEREARLRAPFCHEGILG